MQPQKQENGEDNFDLPKILALLIIVVFLIFVFNIVGLWITYLPHMEQMEEAGEETSQMMEETGGEGVSIIQAEMIPEIELVFTLSLICFGLLDGIFALMLWRTRVKNRQQLNLGISVLAHLLIRTFSLSFISSLTVQVMVGHNSRALMNALYMTVPIFSAASLVIIIIVYKVVLAKKRATKILNKISEDTAF